MHPMAKIVDGRITLEIPAGENFTFDHLKDLHTRALMVGLPTDATITRIAWHMRPETTAPQQVSVYYQVEPELRPAQRFPEERPAPQIPPMGAVPPVPPRVNPFPNPMAQE